MTPGWDVPGGPRRSPVQYTHAMSRADVVRQVATFFGGPYDPATHLYTAPTVAGLGMVRGAFHKGEPHSDMWQHLTEGTPTGSLLIVFCRHAAPDAVDDRVCTPGSKRSGSRLICMCGRGRISGTPKTPKPTTTR